MALKLLGSGLCGLSCDCCHGSGVPLCSCSVDYIVNGCYQYQGTANRGQSLPRIWTGVLFTTILCMARILGNNCPQIKRLLHDYVKLLYLSYLI